MRPTLTRSLGIISLRGHNPPPSTLAGALPLAWLEGNLSMAAAARILAALAALPLLGGNPAPGAAEEPPPQYPERTRLLVVRDGQGTETAVTTPEQWRQRRQHILENMQRVMGPLPAPLSTPFDLVVAERTDLGPYERRKISFAAEAGDRLTGYLLVPHRAQRRPAVLCQHQTVKVGAAEPVGLGGRPTLRYAQELAERGYVALAIDYPNFGEYACDVYARGYASATMKGIVNHRRAIDLLCSLEEVDPARIGVIGHSLGGHNSLFIAAFDERVRATVTSCGFCSFRTYKKGDLAGWSHRGYMPRIAERYGADPQRMPFDFPEVLAAIAPRAVLVVAPRHDDNFDHAGVIECVDAAKPVFELLGAPERLAADYPDAPHDFPDESRARAYAWLDRWLKP